MSVRTSWPHYADLEGRRARLFQNHRGEWFVSWWDGSQTGPYCRRNAVDSLHLSGYVPHFPEQTTLVDTGPVQVGLFDQPE